MRKESHLILLQIKQHAIKKWCNNFYSITSHVSCSKKYIKKLQKNPTIQKQYK